MKSNEVIQKNLLDARAIVETAVSEKRSMTEEERNKAYNLYNEAKEGMDDASLQNKINQLEAEALKSQSEVQKPQVYQDLGSQFINSDEFKNWMKVVAPNGRIPENAKGLTSPSFSTPMPLEKKALIIGADPTSAGAFIQPDDSGIYSRIGYPEPTLRDLVSVRQTTSDAVDFVLQTTQVTTAAPVAEASSAAGPTVSGSALIPNVDGGYKPEGEMEWYRMTALVETIATYIPATKRAIADAGQLRGLINQELREALYTKLEDQMINGNGFSPQLVGVASTPALLTQAFNTDILTTARKAITELKTNGLDTPTAFVIDPLDWEKVELQLFAAAPYLPYQKSMWRVPVVEFGGLPADTAYLANWKRAVLWDREDVSISITDSHADFFIRNILAILAELRAAFAVTRPSSFVEMATA